MDSSRTDACAAIRLPMRSILKMTKKYLVIDFETKDPYISRGLGAGWVFAVNKVPGCDFKVLGVAVRCSWVRNPTSLYLQLVTCDDNNWIDTIRNLVNECDAIIMHNASYDLGCLKVLGIDVKDKPLLDTMIMAKLYDSSMNTYDLDYLGRKFTGLIKDKAGLIKAAVDGPYPWLKKDLIAKAKAEKLFSDVDSMPEFKREVDDKKVLKWVMTNMDIMQEECYNTIAEYACTDVDVTYKLFMFFSQKTDHKLYMDLAYEYSFTIYPAMRARIQGMRINLKSSRQAIRDLQPVIIKAHNEVYRIAGEEFNISSGPDKARIFDKLGIKYPFTDKGNPSITSKWMENQNHKICKAIVLAKKYVGGALTVIRQIIAMQEHTLGMTVEEVDDQDYGRIYPEWKPMWQKNGRISATKPAITNMPGRDPIAGPICRGIFVPEEGENFYGPDYSNQEGRIHLHYALRLNLDGAQRYADEFIADPSFDMHKKVAGIMGCDRDTSKPIYLGKMYGAGGAKICDQLGLPTDWWTPKDSDTPVRVAGEEGRALIKEFDNAIPYCTSFIKTCSDSMKKKGYITTISGRRLKAEWAIVKGKKHFFYYQASSQLSQGSAYDQLVKAVNEAYRQGLPVIGYVHDQMLMSGTKKQGLALQKIMLNAIVLKIPSYVDLGEGKNWAEAH